MTGSYAWLGSLDLKEEILADLAEDRARERYVQGSFIAGANDDDQAFYGCHIGCLMMAQARHENRHAGDQEPLYALVRAREDKAASWHGQVPEKLGMPKAIAEFWDKFFEKLSPALAPRFAVESLECVPVGANLSNVLPELVAWILPTFLEGVELVFEPERQLSRYVETVAGAWRARADDFTRPAASGIDPYQLDITDDDIRGMVRGFPTDPTTRFHWASLASASASSGAVVVHVANALIDEWAEAIAEGAMTLPELADQPFDFAAEAIEIRDRALWVVATKLFELCAAAPQGTEQS